MTTTLNFLESFLSRDQIWDCVLSREPAFKGLTKKEGERRYLADVVAFRSWVPLLQLPEGQKDDFFYGSTLTLYGVFDVDYLQEEDAPVCYGFCYAESLDWNTSLEYQRSLTVYEEEMPTIANLTATKLRLEYWTPPEEPRPYPSRRPHQRPKY